MSKYDDIEKILSKLAEEEPEKMDNIDEIDELAFHRIEHKFKSEIMDSKNHKAAKTKKHTEIFLKAMAAAVCLFAVFSVALYFIDLPNTKAAEDVNAIGEAETFAPHEVNMPEYLPDGFNIDYMTTGVDANGYSTIEMKYTDSDNEGLYILIRINGEQILEPYGVDHEIKELEKNSMPFMIEIYDTEPAVIYSEFMDAWGDLVQIETTLDEETLLNVIESMD